jgi:hypothetical protein
MSLIRNITKIAGNSALNKDLRNSSENLLEIKLINFLKRATLFLKEKKLVRFMERAYLFLTTRDKDTKKYISYHIFDNGLDMKSSNKIKDWLSPSRSLRAYNVKYYKNHHIYRNIDFNFPVVGFIDPNIHTSVISNIDTINMILTENCKDYFDTLKMFSDSTIYTLSKGNIINKRVDKKIRNSYKHIIRKNNFKDHDTFYNLLIPIYNIFSEFIPNYSLDKFNMRKANYFGIQFSKDVYMSSSIDILCYPKGGKFNPHRDDVSKKSDKHFAKKGFMCFTMILCINSESTDLTNSGTIIWNSIRKGLTYDPHYFASGVTGYGVLMKSDCLHSGAENIYNDNIFKMKVDFYINPKIFTIGKHVSYHAKEDFDPDNGIKYSLEYRLNVTNKSDEKTYSSIVSNRLNYSNCRCVLCCKDHNDFNSLNIRVKIRNPNYINILCRIQTKYGDDVCFGILEFLDIQADPSVIYDLHTCDTRVCYCNRYISQSNNNTLIKHFSDREISDCSCNCQKCLDECKSWKVSFYNEATQSVNFLRDEMRYITNVYEQTLMSLSHFDFQDKIYTDSSIRKGVKYDLKTLGQRILNLSKRIDDGKKYYKSLEGRRTELLDSYYSDYDDEYDCNGDY